MKAILLLALRTTTGSLLIVWGAFRVLLPAEGVHVSEKYYSGLISGETLRVCFGWAEIGLGLLVILGLLRTIVYPLQALILVGGSIAIWKHLLDPLSLYLFVGDDRANILFFPSVTVAVASLILIAFKNYDTITLDQKLSSLGSKK